MLKRILKITSLVFIAITIVFSIIVISKYAKSNALSDKLSSPSGSPFEIMEMAERRDVLTTEIKSLSVWLAIISLMTGSITIASTIVDYTKKDSNMENHNKYR